MHHNPPLLQIPNRIRRSPRLILLANKEFVELLFLVEGEKRK